MALDVEVELRPGALAALEARRPARLALVARFGDVPEFLERVFFEGWDLETAEEEFRNQESGVRGQASGVRTAAGKFTQRRNGAREKNG